MKLMWNRIKFVANTIEKTKTERGQNTTFKGMGTNLQEKNHLIIKFSFAILFFPTRLYGQKDL